MKSLFKDTEYWCNNLEVDGTIFNSREVAKLGIQPYLSFIRYSGGIEIYFVYFEPGGNQSKFITFEHVSNENFKKTMIKYLNMSLKEIMILVKLAKL